MSGFFRVFCEKTRKNPGGLGFFKKSGFFANPVVSTNIFLWGRNPLLEGGYIWPVMPISELGWVFQSKVMCGNLAWIDWNWRYVNFEGGGGYMWPAMPIFELGRGCLDKSHVWKFWFTLVEAFKSYRGDKPNGPRTRTRTRTRTKIFKVKCRSLPYQCA